MALAGRGGMGEVHRGLARKTEWLEAIVVVLVAASTNTGGDYPIVKFAAAALMWLSIVPILRRYGLLALVVGLVVQKFFWYFPSRPTSRGGMRRSDWRVFLSLPPSASMASTPVWGQTALLSGRAR